MTRPRRSHEDCPNEAVLQALKCIAGRWKILILRQLQEGAIGFNALERALPGISPKMLRQQLRELEADGLVTRTELISTPPKTVRYTLAPLGRTLIPVLDTIGEWGRKWLNVPERR
ncbi:MAG: helix-turn-helix domain-containing protein [Pseudomonadota bacterium]